MKFSALIKLTILANVVAANFFSMSSAKASTFEEKEMAQDRVIAVAAPYRHGYNLVVIEQLPGKDKCWAEQGIAPVAIDALLMNFDFSGHCRRATDSNGYSVRLGGEERGSDYLLKIVEQDNELILVATQRDPNEPPLIIGRTNGRQAGITKIFLNPGWRFTKRSYQGKELSHFYFSEGVAPIANAVPKPATASVEPTALDRASSPGISVTATVTVTPPKEKTTANQNASTPQEANQLF